jgi:hypothetical protein
LRSPTSIEWSSLESIANGDAAVAAAEPSAFAYGSTGAVAWREHDRILARASSYTEFGAAIALNVDPARAARRPRFDGYVSDATVYWIEQGAAGDEIWGRRWDGSEWRLLPGPVNAGAEGGVRTFDVINGAVVWVDDVGATRIRVAAF